MEADEAFASLLKQREFFSNVYLTSELKIPVLSKYTNIKNQIPENMIIYISGKWRYKLNSHTK